METKNIHDDIHENDERNCIGKNIAYCRKHLGMTQSELAGKLFVTQRAVSKWECGRSLPDVSLLPQIAKVFGISLDELASEDFSYDHRTAQTVVIEQPVPMPVLQERTMDPRTKKRIRILLIALAAALAVSAAAILLSFYLSRYSGSTFTFEAEWGTPDPLSQSAVFSENVNESSGKGFIDFISTGNTVRYSVTSDGDISALLTLCIGLRTDLNYRSLSEVFSILVNGVSLTLTEPVPLGQSNNWHDWHEIGAGKIALRQGENSIEITSINPLCLDYISIQPKSASTVLTFEDCTDFYDGERIHVTTNDLSAVAAVFGQGYDLSAVYDMDEYIGSTFANYRGQTNVYQDGWISQYISEDRTWKVYARAGEETKTMVLPVSVELDAYMFEAEWAQNGQGDVACYNPGVNGSSGKGFADFCMGDDETSSLVFTVNAEEDVAAQFDLCLGMVREEYALSRVYQILLNGTEYVSEAVVPRTTKNIWHEWFLLDTGEIHLKKGINTIEFVGRNPALCLDYIRFRPKRPVGLSFADCNFYYEGAAVSVPDDDVSALSEALGGARILSIVDMDEYYSRPFSEFSGYTELFDGERVQFFWSGEKNWKVTASIDGRTIRTIVRVQASFSERVRLEAEQAVLDGNARKQSGFASSGGFYVDYFDSGKITFTFEAEEEMLVEPVFCVGLVSGNSFSFDMLYAVSVNGVDLCVQSYVPRGEHTGEWDWHDWTAIRTGKEVTLHAGINVIEIEGRFEETGYKPLCVDYMALI